MKKTATKEIGGSSVTTIQLPSLKGSALRFKVGKMFSSTAREQDAVAKADLTMAILGSLDEKQVEQLMLEVLICTSVTRTEADGKLIKFDLTTAKIIDLAFDGDVDSLWETFRFALEMNLTSFATSAGTEQPAPTP